MFKRVITTKGFWRSVFALAAAFAILFTVVKWALEGFKMSYFTDKNPLIHFLLLIAAGMVYGFFVSFGKFRRKIKESESRR